MNECHFSFQKKQLAFYISVNYFQQFLIQIQQI